MPVIQDEEEAEAEHGHDVSRQGEEEEKEVAVVPPADAVVYPGTVVVEVLQGWGRDGGTGGRERERNRTETLLRSNCQ